MSSFVNLEPGSYVFFEEEEFQITAILDLECVIARQLSNGMSKKLYVKDLYLEGKQEIAEIDVSQVADKEWNLAINRFQIIKPLLKPQANMTLRVEKIAIKTGFHPSTIYRWLKAYNSTKLVSSLMRSDQFGGKGKVRLDDELEEIIEIAIEKEYKTEQKKKVVRTIEYVEMLCFQRGIKPPHKNTIRNRIKAISEKERMRSREGKKAAREHYGSAEGEFPNADFPLSYVQIDHTEVDIILVDDEYRLPIGRPWITVAIDVNSRVVAGFYVSLESPSAMSVGLCLSQAILDKDEWLKEYSSESAWPVWGFMKTIHADNAGEFRGDMLQRVCVNYDIDLRWRPVARPNYGAHIERFLGTLGSRIHDLPGTTFSNPKDRGVYDSDKNAAFTLSDFNQWLTCLIVDYYHNDRHSSINMPPLTKYQEGILGTSTKIGIGLPRKPNNAERLKLDFLPCIERTVQRSGIQWDNIFYFGDLIRRWINSIEPDSSRKRKFLVRRDPRDISKLYFYDPELQQYFEIPYANPAHPVVTLWEWRAVERKLKEDGQNKVDEEVKFRALIRMRELEESAVVKTKKARRNKQRRKEAEINSYQEIADSSSNVVRLRPEKQKRLDRASIKPFDDLEG